MQNLSMCVVDRKNTVENYPQAMTGLTNGLDIRTFKNGNDKILKSKVDNHLVASL